MSILSNFIKSTARHFATKAKPLVNTDKNVLEAIKNEVFTPKQHPGIYKPRNIVLPDKYVEAITNVLADYPVKALLKESATLANYLHSRLAPLEQEDFSTKCIEAENEVLSHHCNLEIISPEERNELRKKFQIQIHYALKRNVYAWQPINYDVYTSLQYLLARCCQDYAVLVRLFKEITVRDKEFNPRSFFDFGSGVGTGTWAVHTFWDKQIFEHFNVDISGDMNELALTLLKMGRGNKAPNIKGVFYRQFLPANNTTYDIVLSAFSLLELPNSKARLDTVLKLWNKTEKYLVIVEQGTNAGFKVVNEARDLVLELKNQNEEKTGHVFSPCPHDFTCPRSMTEDSPCNFEISYSTLPIGQSVVSKRERFTYVILKKGTEKDLANSWPRVVRPILVKSKHAICRLCCESGKLEEVIFTASKHGKDTYYCAKSSKWGDQLPISIEKHLVKEENTKRSSTPVQKTPNVTQNSYQT